MTKIRILHTHTRIHHIGAQKLLIRAFCYSALTPYNVCWVIAFFKRKCAGLQKYQRRILRKSKYCYHQEITSHSKDLLGYKQPRRS